MGYPKIYPFTRLADHAWGTFYSIRAANLDSYRFRTPNYLFIWVPKTAGTSIFASFQRALGMVKLKTVKQVFEVGTSGTSFRGVTFGHLSTDNLIEFALVPRGALQDSISFAVVRNPFDRAFSIYRYFQKIGRMKDDVSFEAFLRQLSPRQLRVGPWHSSGLSQASPMVSWLQPNRWPGPKVIFKFESLQSEILSWAEANNLSIKLPKKNVGSARAEDHEWSKAEEALVQELYREDFVSYGYSTELPPCYKKA